MPYFQPGECEGPFDFWNSISIAESAARNVAQVAKDNPGRAAFLTNADACHLQAIARKMKQWAKKNAD